MKTNIRTLAALTAYCIPLTLGAYAMEVKAPKEGEIPPTLPQDERESEKQPESRPQDKLPENRRVWLQKLIQCESSGNPEAINPLDRDGTPSYGILQFKQSTFDMYQKRYGLQGELMDPQAQIETVIRMMDDARVRWENEFPMCVTEKGVGRPPTVLP